MKLSELVFLMKKKMANICYNGESFSYGLDDGEKSHKFSLKKEELEFQVDMKIYPKYQAIYWKTSVTNNGTENSEPLTELSLMMLDIPMEKSVSVLHKGLKGDSVSADSFLPFETAVTCGDLIRKKPYGGKSSHYAFPFFDVCLKDGGMIFAIGWSGTWFYELERTDKELKVSAGLPDMDFYVKPGETLQLPSMLIKVYDGSYRTAHNEFRALMKNHFSLKTRFGDKMRMPISLQNFDRYTYDMPYWNTEEGQLKEVEFAKRVEHVNAYWLDAAWFAGGFPKGVGNYSFREGFPNGLTNIDKRVHEYGMKALIWFEPERVAPGTEVFEEHPEYLIIPKDVNEKSVLFDLSNPEALEWVTETICGFIKDYEIDIYRHDFNIYPAPFWKMKDEEGRNGITEIKYIEGLYKFYDTLLERFPKLMIDCCASGGNRMDLETYSRCVYCWRSDTGCYPDSDTVRSSVWNQNQNLALSDYIVYHAIACWTPIAYDVRSAMANGYAANFDVFDAACDFDKITTIFEEVERIGVYWEDDFYPMSAADLAEDHWSVWQFGKENAGVLQVFRREKSKQSSQKVTFYGLDTSAKYLLKIADDDYQIMKCIVSGEELTKGYVFVLAQPRSSLVVEYQKQ